MKQVSLTLLVLLFVFFSNAQYVFIGNGAWSDISNWQNGVKPPSSTIASGVTVTIQGSAITSSGFPYDLGANNGSLIIATGGSLSINIETQFSNAGSVTVNGSLTNNTMWEAYNGSSVTINGTFTNTKTLGNQGLITINNGGVINNSNTGNLDNTFVNPIGQMVLNCGGTINNAGIFKPGNLTVNSCGGITNSATLSGNSTINGNLINSGTLSPGNSPGTYTINGDYTATSTAIHNFEVAGTASGNYDVLQVNGNLNLNGSLNVSLLNGFSPSTDHDLTIMTGTISGSFTTVNIPSSYILLYNSNSVVLRHSSALPVNFIDISIRKQNNGQKISWKVQSEENVLRYEIEKSQDGNRFTKIGFLDAVGVDSYDFDDLKAETKCFYRIKSLDISGSYKYSAIGFYKQGTNSVKLSAYPSPTHGSIIIQHPTTTKLSKFYIISSDGKIIKTIIPHFRTQQTQIDVSSLKTGVYFVRFYSEGKSQTITIEKL